MRFCNFGCYFCESQLFNRPSVSVTSQLTTVPCDCEMLVASVLLRRNLNQLNQLQVQFFILITSKSNRLIFNNYFCEIFCVRKECTKRFRPCRCHTCSGRKLRRRCTHRSQPRRSDPYFKTKNSKKKLQANHSFCMKN